MELKIGSTVVVDKKTSIIETIWNQGTDRVFKLTDGRLIHNLDKIIAEGNAQLMSSPAQVISTQKDPELPKKIEKWEKRERWLPKEGE